MSPRVLGFLVALTIVPVAGCSTLSRSADRSDLELASDAASSAPVCTVDNMAGGKRKRTEVPVTGEMTVQTALNEAGKMPRGNLDIYVIRPTPGEPGPRSQDELPV